MTNKTDSVLYVGVTDNIVERFKEHKLKKYPKSFTAKFNCNKLVYYEEHANPSQAMQREKQIKKMEARLEDKFNTRDESTMDGFNNKLEYRFY